MIGTDDLYTLYHISELFGSRYFYLQWNSKMRSRKWRNMAGVKKKAKGERKGEMAPDAVIKDAKHET